PYFVAPLAPDWVSLAALQARALLDAGGCTERDVAALLQDHRCPMPVDGAAAAVLVAGDLARKVCARPAWIRGIDHRIEAHSLGVRDLTRSPSTRRAAEKAGAVGRAFD